MKIKTILILVLILIISLFCSQLMAKVSLQRVVYKGWTDSYRLSSGIYSLTVVPEIGGRIMEYSYDGRNVIWEDPNEYSIIYPIANEWHNYGGHKTWVAPQALWGWPPDPMIDYGKANVEVLKNANGLPVIKVTGAPSLKLGLTVTKEISLDDSGTVKIKQEVYNIGGKPVSYGVWNLTYMRTPGFITFPIKPRSKFPDGIAFFTDESKTSKQFMVRDGLSITRYLGEQGLIGSDTDASWMIYFQDDLAYVKSFDPMKKDMEYPNGGCSVQVFTGDSKSGYLEMEVFGPVTSVKPGEHIELTEQWQIRRLSQPITDENWVVKAVKGMRGKGWIP